MLKHPPAFLADYKTLKKDFGFPLYVYDAHKIKEQFHNLTMAFQTADLSIHYACKANSNIQILKILKELGAEVDIVSTNEGKLAQLAGFSPQEIHYTPNGVAITEYYEAISQGYNISVDNIEIMKQIAEYRPGCALCVRINPSVKAGGHDKISVGHKRSKFGLPVTQLEEVLHLNQSGAIQVKGLHIHTGSDIKNVEAIKKAAKVLLEKAAPFSEKLEFLDFGGGFKVAYQETEKDAEIGEIAQWLQQEINIFNQTHKTKLKIVIEPGKYLVSEAGYFLAEVTQMKDVYGTRFVYLNAGFNHFIRPMYYDAYHHISNLSNPQGSPEKVDVVGFLCENDTFAKDRLIPKVQVGDILCFHNAGAYSYTMSSSYNLRERPAEVLIEGKNVKIIQKRQVFKDLINGQVI